MTTDGTELLNKMITKTSRAIETLSVLIDWEANGRVLRGHNSAVVTVPDFQILANKDNGVTCLNPEDGLTLRTPQDAESIATQARAVGLDVQVVSPLAAYVGRRSFLARHLAELCAL